MIKQLFLGLLLGSCTILFFGQYDAWVKQKITTMIISIFENSFNCTVTGCVESASLLPLTVTMKNLLCSPRNKNKKEWFWSAEKFSMNFSWPSIFMGHSLTTSIVMENVHAYSSINDGKLALFPHVQDLIRGPKSSPAPVVLKTVQMRSASVTMDNGLSNTFYWNGESRRIGPKFCSQFYVYDGSIASENTVFVKNISGTIGLETVEQQETIIPTMRVDGRGELPHLNNYSTCFITGRWFDQRGRFQIQSIDQSLVINPLIVTEENNRFHINATIYAPVWYLNKIFVNFDAQAQGMVRMNIKTDAHAEGNGECQWICEDMAHPWFKTPVRLRGTCIKRGLDVEGNWDMYGDMHMAYQSTFRWDGVEKKGTALVTNSLPISIPWQSSWLIKPRTLQLKMTYALADAELIGTILGTAVNTAKGNELSITGNCLLDAQAHLTGQGAIGDYYGMVSAWMDKAPQLDDLKLFNKKGYALIDCHYQSDNDHYTGHIDVALLRLLSDTLFHYDVHSEGTLLFNAQLKNHLLYAYMQLKEATIRLPQTLNFIQDCVAAAEIDLEQRKVILKGVRGALHTGIFHIPRAVAWFDTHGGLQFLHMPLLLNHCLFTIKRDLFAMVSGALLLQKKGDDDAHLTGSIILDRSQLKENIFAASVQKKLFRFSDVAKIMPPLPLHCDVRIETKDPIRIDTHFLEANAQVSLHVQDYLSQPKVSGIIWVPSGSIRFPYKPLIITKAEITFLPEQSLNPLIEIIAKNNIKKHNITLHVTGSLRDHMVMLEAAPPLTEEQIVGLLIAGAHEESLQAIIPSLLMQNVTSYIFSSHKSNFFDHYIKPWMKKINVQLKPNFNDQSGRGGLRGALEITVNERWRALIEKNFTLTEDTRFELEYILSDDVTFRIIRDERCDIGAEVEMKWKF